jgi:hypothetical protein
MSAISDKDKFDKISVIPYFRNIFKELKKIYEKLSIIVLEIIDNKQKCNEHKIPFVLPKKGKNNNLDTEVDNQYVDEYQYSSNKFSLNIEFYKDIGDEYSEMSITNAKNKWFYYSRFEASSKYLTTSVKS